MPGRLKMQDQKTQDQKNERTENAGLKMQDQMSGGENDIWSCKIIFTPGHLVMYFQVPHFHPFGPAFSGPAFSVPAALQWAMDVIL